MPSRSDAIAKEVIKMIVVFKNAPKVALLTVISIAPISEDAVLRLVMDSKTTFDNKHADDMLLIISNKLMRELSTTLIHNTIIIGRFSHKTSFVFMDDSANSTTLSS